MKIIFNPLSLEKNCIPFITIIIIVLLIILITIILVKKEIKK